MSSLDAILRLAGAIAAYLREIRRDIGVAIIGRHLFDRTDGWGGRRSGLRGDAPAPNR